MQHTRAGTLGDYTLLRPGTNDARPLAGSINGLEARALGGLWSAGRAGLYYLLLTPGRQLSIDRVIASGTTRTPGDGVFRPVWGVEVMDPVEVVAALRAPADDRQKTSTWEALMKANGQDLPNELASGLIVRLGATVLKSFGDDPASVEPSAFHIQLVGL